MNEVHFALYDSLQTFKDDRDSYEELLDESSVEVTNSTRVIKKEVIEMADMIDKQSALMLSQDKKIDKQSEFLKKGSEDISVIMKLLENNLGPLEIEDEQLIEEIKEDEEDSTCQLPELYSIRKNPIYKAKVAMR